MKIYIMFKKLFQKKNPLDFGLRFVMICAIIFIFMPKPMTAFTAEKIYFSDIPAEIEIGKEFSAALLIDSDQPINAYSVNFSFTPQTAEFVSFDNSKSVIDVWQDRPLVFQGGAVKFSGGSLSPFSGQRGKIISIRFRPLKEGIFDLMMGNTSVYLANGKGTKVNVSDFGNAELMIKKPRIGEPAGSTIEPVISRAASGSPEIKLASLAKDPFNAEQKLLGFLARADSSGGIEDVFVRWRTFIFWTDWQRTINPAAVPASAWSVELEVFDQNGSSARKTFYDWPVFIKLASFSLLMLLILIFSLARVLKSAMRKSG